MEGPRLNIDDLANELLASQAGPEVESTAAPKPGSKKYLMEQIGKICEASGVPQKETARELSRMSRSSLQALVAEYVTLSEKKAVQDTLGAKSSCDAVLAVTMLRMAHDTAFKVLEPGVDSVAKEWMGMTIEGAIGEGLGDQRRRAIVLLVGRCRNVAHGVHEIREAPHDDRLCGGDSRGRRHGLHLEKEIRCVVAMGGEHRVGEVQYLLLLGGSPRPTPVRGEGDTISCVAADLLCVGFTMRGAQLRGVAAELDAADARGLLRRCGRLHAQAPLRRAATAATAWATISKASSIWLSAMSRGGRKRTQFE